MNSTATYLLTILSERMMLATYVAVQVDLNNLPEEFNRYPTEPENLAALRALLPESVREIGPVIGVDDLLGIHIC